MSQRSAVPSWEGQRKLARRPSFLQRVAKGLFGITFGGPGVESWQSSRDWETAALPANNGMTDPYAQHPVVSRIEVVAVDAASIPWEAFDVSADPENDDPVEDHPLLLALEKPNKFMAGAEIFIATYVYRKYLGECFWYYPDFAVGINGGLKASRKPSGEIHVLDPRAVHLDLTTGQPVWWVQQRGERVVLKADALTQFKRFNPSNPWRGLSEIASLRLELDGDWNAGSWNVSFFGEQNGMPAGVLKPPEGDTNTPEERESFQHRWASRTSRRQTTAVVPPGWEFADISATQKDMDFRSLREYARELTLSVIGLPPFYAGVLENANYANAREQKEVYWHGTIMRLVTETQSVLNNDFLPKIGVTDIRLFPSWEKVRALTENLNEKADIAGKFFAMGFTKRQINERLELGFEVDDLEDADIGYLPFNLAPVDQILNPPEPVLMPGNGVPEEEGAPPPPQKRLNRSLAGKSEVQRAMHWRNIVSRTRDLEASFNSVVRRHFNEIRTEILANMDGTKGWLAVQTKAVDPLWFDSDEAKRKLQKQTAPLYRISIMRGGELVFSETDITGDFNLQDPNVHAKLAELTYKITRIDDTVERAIRAEMQEGLLAGENVAQLSARVRHVMDVSMGRSMAIARTETGHAFSAGRFIGMKQAGVNRHEWLTARDSKVRDSHQIDGAVVHIGEPFPKNGLLYPQDPSGPADEVINCRCVAVPVLGDPSTEGP